MKALGKIHNSDDDKIWTRFKSTIPHQKIDLRSEGSSQVLSSGERKTMLDETMDTQTQSSLNNSNSTNNSFQAPAQNLFVIKTHSGSKKKFTRFNKIKAINPIPDIETLTPREEHPIHRTFSAKQISLTTRGNMTTCPDISLMADSRLDTYNSESNKKLINIKHTTFEVPHSGHVRVASAQGKLPITTIKLDKTTTPREKKNTDNFSTPVHTDRTVSTNKIQYEKPDIRMKKQILSCPKPGSMTFNFDLSMQEKPARTKTLVNLDTETHLPSLDLRSLISPQYRPQLVFAFQGANLTPMKTEGTLSHTELNDSAGTRKITAKFRTQEMIVNKIFNSNNHKKNL
jgi:hypothetical protein